MAEPQVTLPGLFAALTGYEVVALDWPNVLTVAEHELPPSFHRVVISTK